MRYIDEDGHTLLVDKLSGEDSLYGVFREFRKSGDRRRVTNIPTGGNRAEVMERLEEYAQKHNYESDIIVNVRLGHIPMDKTVTETLQVTLTTEERLELSIKQGELHDEIGRVEAEREQANNRYKERVKGLEKDLWALWTPIRSGEREEKVEGVWVRDIDEGEMHFVRLDPLTIMKSRPMTQEEAQTDAVLDGPAPEPVEGEVTQGPWDGSQAPESTEAVPVDAQQPGEPVTTESVEETTDADAEPTDSN